MATVSDALQALLDDAEERVERVEVGEIGDRRHALSIRGHRGGDEAGGRHSTLSGSRIRPWPVTSGFRLLVRSR